MIVMTNQSRPSRTA